MKAVVQAAGADLNWIEALAGLDAISAYGVPLPPATLDLIRRYRVAIKGPCTTPVGKGFRSINVQLRKNSISMPACVRCAPCRAWPCRTPTSISSSSAKTPKDCTPVWNIPSFPGVVESLRIITRPAAERIVRFAFELARQQGRRA